MTREDQFQEILDSMINGQWTAAQEECVEYNFHAKDLTDLFEEYKRETTVQPCNPLDLVFLIEGATKMRCKK